jgi:hypothetical protein
VRALPADTVVVTGDARGVDAVVAATCRETGREHYVLVPCWDSLGRSAGPARNEALVRMVDRLVAFHADASPGTASCVRIARRYGRPVEVFGAEVAA